jgi:hypothetical protein
MATKTTPVPVPQWGRSGPLEPLPVEYQTLTVRRVGDGLFLATHGRLDVASSRVVFSQVEVAEMPATCPHYMAHLLLEAAYSWDARVHEDRPLL